VVTQDKHGEICLTLAASLGYDTNNLVKLWALIKWIQVASQFGFHPIIMECDSKIIITFLTNILKGSDPLKISPN